MITITMDDLEKCRLRHSAHLDGPRGRDGWFGDMHTCLEYPRLQRRVRYWRKTRSHDVTWFVDGAAVGPDLAATLPLLNVPPVLTAEEQQVFALVTDQFTDLRQDMDVLVLMGLRAKGVIEFQAGRCRRTLTAARWTPAP